MTSILYKNETIKRKFCGYLGGPKGFSKKSIESYEQAIWLWEDYSGKADFANFNQTVAKEFVDWLRSKKKAGSDSENISLSYCYDILRHIRFFFEWLSKQPKYKSKINETAIEYLGLTKKEIKVATKPKGVVFPSLEEVKAVIENIGGNSEVERRDRALISLALITGARISALITLPIRCFDKNNQLIDQDPKFGVNTKFSKRIITPLFPISYKEPRQYFNDWFDYLKNKNGFGLDDPIFPATKIENGKENISYYSSGDIVSVFWKNTSSARKIFEKRFKQADVKYYHPHSFRHRLVKEISKLPLTEEQKKAISQSLGHENTGTTFGSYGYGQIDESRQIEIIQDIDFSGQNSRKYVIDDAVLRRLTELDKK